MMKMKAATLATAASLLALGLSMTACNKPEDPAKTEADVLKAQADGQAKVNAAANDALKEHADNAADALAAGKPMSASDAKTDIDNLHKVDTTLADANYKVAKEKCDALTGAAKDACLDTAKAQHEADLAAAKADQANAKAAIDQQKK